ncbi:signal peptidase II [Piscinibacter koreensis]|uniref:Lipoprotein signal peptidase n=1 Tax=Piscinibacter koreensis TaxID=2742824 RepID=A0A7Y6NSA1_9BURK|nr:signal peptidase II [Schlegelella koreensis]NUZ08400.1 lipoprotein signal peptidase [Schlegelella koreensis]
MRTDCSVRLAFALAALVVAADAATKGIIAAVVPYGSSHEWLPVLNIVHLLNRGAAFSFLHDAGGWQRLFFIGVALVASVLLVFMIRRADSSRAERISFGLILGGAVANMIDRIARGAVVDWIDVHWAAHHWPAFNVADIGITMGAALLIAYELFGRKRAQQRAEQERA